MLWGRLDLFRTSHDIELYQSNIIWLTKTAEIEQSFLSRYPGLYRIDVFLARQTSLDNEITFHLKESCNAKRDLRTVVITVTNAEANNGAFSSFIFEPIDESNNHQYCFTLDTTDVQNDVGVWASDTDVYQEGQATYVPASTPVAAKMGSNLSDSAHKYRVFLPVISANDKYQPQVNDSIDLGFQLYYDGQSLETIKVFVAHLVEFKPNLFGAPAFYILLTATYLIGLFLLIRTVIAESLGAGEE